jgi:hypothetical protein
LRYEFSQCTEPLPELRGPRFPSTSCLRRASFVGFLLVNASHPYFCEFYSFKFFRIDVQITKSRLAKRERHSLSQCKDRGSEDLAWGPFGGFGRIRQCTETTKLAFPQLAEKSISMLVPLIFLASKASFQGTQWVSSWLPELSPLGSLAIIFCGFEESGIVLLAQYSLHCYSSTNWHQSYWVPL